MAEPLRKAKAPAKIVLRQARAAEIRSSLGIGASDKMHARAAIVAVKKAAAKTGVRPARQSARKPAAAKLRRSAERVKAGGGKS